jgi:hypothetical protein
MSDLGRHDERPRCQARRLCGSVCGGRRYRRAADGPASDPERNLPVRGRWSTSRPVPSGSGSTIGPTGKTAALVFASSFRNSRSRLSVPAVYLLTGTRPIRTGSVPWLAVARALAETCGPIFIMLDDSLVTFDPQQGRQALPHVGVRGVNEPLQGAGVHVASGLELHLLSTRTILGHFGCIVPCLL